MVTWLEGMLLGAVQGLTEWLPISSSGHLVLVHHFVPVEDPVAFDLILHVASLLVILLVFWRDIFELLKGVLNKDKESINYVVKIIIASIPIAIVGVLFEDMVDAAFSNLLSVGICLFLTAVLLLLSKYPLEKEKPLGGKEAIIVGIAQAVAIFPGLSRSGATVSAGLMQGVKREDSARFAFLIAIPAIAGAAIFKLDEFTAIVEVEAIVVGFFTCIIVGFLSLKLLLKILNANKFHYFAFYCIAIGVLCIVLFLV
jgi:undecaprenyl-diphosphatase